MSEALGSVLPLLAATPPDDKTGFYVTLAIIVAVVVLFIGLLIYVARRSRAIDIDDDGREP